MANHPNRSKGHDFPRRLALIARTGTFILVGCEPGSRGNVATIDTRQTEQERVGNLIVCRYNDFEELAKALRAIVADASATYDAIADGGKPVISVGQFGRLARARELLTRV